MNVGTYFYDFRIDGKNVGYFELRIEEDKIYQNVKFQSPDGVYENPFYLMLRQGRVTAFKKADQNWISMSLYQENQFPSSSFPLLLPLVTDYLEYFQISEATGLVEGPLRLERIGSVIHEFQEQNFRRSFRIENGVIVEINWGGAISKIKNTFDEAVAEII